MRLLLATAVLWLALPAHAGVQVLNRRLEAKQTLSAALKDGGVNTSQAVRLLEALSDVFDVRSAHAGDQLRIVTVDGFVEHLDFRVDPLDEYQVWREGWRYVAQKRAVDYQHRVARLSFD